ncbi:receptor-type tyrosine-protein phosphatase F [Podospora conica]|nr:receptor-type tyrosine-protein phosphatase F [Schizothecium conicum]
MTMPSPTRILIVGDSISHGREGDWTWRYRLWQWTRLHRVAAEFVGPYQGTVPPDDPEPPRPPPLPTDPPARGGGWPRSDGGYARDVDADFLNCCRHFAASGRQAMQAKHLVADQIAEFQPDLCLVQLGFNDLAWGVSGPRDTLASMRDLVARARSVNPNLKFAIANVPHRTPYFGGETLPVITDAYNSLLADAISKWSTPSSPIIPVPFCEHYTPSTATYDGLHPNSLGDYQLCHAFTAALTSSSSFFPGLPPLPIPTSCPSRSLPTPTSPTALSTPSGARLTWPPVYGALGYLVRFRPVSSPPAQWMTSRLPPLLHPQFLPPPDHLPLPPPGSALEVEFQLATTPGSLPTDCSPWSHPVKAVHNPLTSPPPSDIKIHGSHSGFRVQWTPRPRGDPAPVDRYGVVVWDVGGALTDEGGVPVRSFGVGAEEDGADVEVPKGRRYRVHVSTWNVGVGQGRGAWSRAVRGGVVGKPGRVRGVEVRRTRGWGEVVVSWGGGGDEGAGEVVVWVREVGGRGEGVSMGVRSAGGRSSVVVGGLRGAVEGYEFAVALWNGDDEGERSEWVGVRDGGVDVGGGDEVCISMRLVV